MLNAITIEEIKKIGKEQAEYNLDKLIFLFHQELSFPLKREIISSIGRQSNNNKILNFIENNVFKDIPMDFVYQMYRTVLYKKNIKQFAEIKEKIEKHYNNEVINRMNFFNENRGIKLKNCKNKITNPTLLIGDNTKTLSRMEESSVDLVFTSPPYYNAREYSSYYSYENYLENMKKTLQSCYKILADGRFIVINVSPVITKRPGREFESIRYPIHFDFHKILTESGFYFIDEIIWVKPEYAVPNRVGGYLQTQTPLSYKPNCITESIMVYRKDAPFLLDKNIKQYNKVRKDNNRIDNTNCWHIKPKSDRNHPAVFPELLCEKVIKYYSFKGDVVLDPFAGSGTFGRVAKYMNRIPLLCEQNQNYADQIKKDGYNVYR